MFKVCPSLKADVNCISNPAEKLYSMIRVKAMGCNAEGGFAVQNTSSKGFRTRGPLSASLVKFCLYISKQNPASSVQNSSEKKSLQQILQMPLSPSKNVKMSQWNHSYPCSVETDNSIPTEDIAQ